MAAAEAHAFDMVNTPTQSCWTESVQPSAPAPRQHDYLGAIVGGVAGRLLGSRFGEGGGRVPGAAVRAGVGAIVDDQFDNRDSSSAPAALTFTSVQRCQQVDHFGTRTTGHEVIYEYDGQRFVTRLPGKPAATPGLGNVAVILPCHGMRD